MGPFVPQHPCAKGPVTYCLDELSVKKDAPALMQKLGDEIMKIEPNDFRGLETVFEHYLLQAVYNDPAKSAKVAAYLKRFWFDETSPDVFFREIQPIAPVYAHGVLKTLDIAKNRQLPIDSWWMMDHPDIEMVNLISPRQVTLVIATPRPAGHSPGGIWGEKGEAWTTARYGVVTRQLDSQHLKP